MAYGSWCRAWLLAAVLVACSAPRVAAARGDRGAAVITGLQDHKLNLQNEYGDVLSNNQVPREPPAAV
jgi:hypothetical protein